MPILDRQELLLALELTKPALASKDLVPELANYWFDGKTVMAYDDVIAMEAPCTLPIKGGVKGAHLVGIVSASGGDTIELKAGTKLEMKIGATKATFSVMDAERRLFSFPVLPAKPTLVITSAFCDVLRRLMRCIGQDPSLPEQMGITIVPGDREMSLYVTDSRSIAYETFPAAWPSRQIVSSIFCEQLLRLCGAAGGKLYDLDEAIVFVSAEGECLYSRYVGSSAPLDFEGVTQRHFGKTKPGYTVIPGELAGALDRALLLLAGSDDPSKMRLAFDGKQILVSVDDLNGERNATLLDTVRGGKSHKAIARSLNPSLIKRALDLCDEMCLMDGCLIMHASLGKFHYFVSAGHDPLVERADLDDEIPF